MAAFFLGTLFFALCELCGFAYVKQRGNNTLNQVLVATSVICCWSMWAIIYIAQMHPLVRPVLAGEKKG